METNNRVIDVTDVARRIFGDIVSSATQLREYRDPYEHEIDDTIINLKFGDVTIEFVNGKRVHISVSEWGRIEAL